MVFNSFHFVAFFSVVLPVYWALPLRFQKLLLLVASYYFYMVWRAKYAVLILGITLLDYGVGLGLARLDKREKARRMFLVLSIAANLGLLFVFKYWTFVGASVTYMAGLLRWRVGFPALDVVIPLGISFHTFQSLSYTIDLYRRKVPVERSLLNFALYVSFFPQLVAGPIERADHLLPQFRRRRSFDPEDMVDGLRLVALGLFKKMAVADNLAPIVDQAYSQPAGALAAPALVVATYAYAFQIYADFSGYSDIATGVARMMGFRLVTNFRTPYFASSVTEFWRRWHISLSSWLRDYLYISLGGNRKGRFRTYLNLMTTMLLGGLWHGASWSFVVWGGLHGLYLSLSKALGELFGKGGAAEASTSSRLLRPLKALATFHLVAFAWIYFRAPSLGSAQAIAGTIVSEAASGRLFAPAAMGHVVELLVLHHLAFALVLLLLGIDLWVENGIDRRRWHLLPMPLRYIGYSVMVVTTLVFGVFRANHFIYFQF